MPIAPATCGELEDGRRVRVALLGDAARLERLAAAKEERADGDGDRDDGPADGPTGEARREDGLKDAEHREAERGAAGEDDPTRDARQSTPDDRRLAGEVRRFRDERHARLPARRAIREDPAIHERRAATAVWANRAELGLRGRSQGPPRSCARARVRQE